MNINEELLKISNISVEAGRIILDYYNKNLNITFKADESPLTQADLASNKFITDTIKKITPNIPILSEEEFIEWDVRKEWKKYWLIDPLDGTKEFIKKNGEFTVNIALIENNRPILGVIYAPASNELYFAKKRYFVFRNKKIIMIDDNRFKLNKGEKIIHDFIRFRTLGCYPLTAGILSKANTIKKVLDEIFNSKQSEREGRLIDKDEASSMELKKLQGYF